ncbi:MAG: hypothetical protein Q8L57_03335, partial [bacterium]|nr:hypothetical protein [bacterium]
MTKKILIVFDASSNDLKDFKLDEENPHQSAAEIIEDAEEIRGALLALGYNASIYDLKGTLWDLPAVIKKERPDLVFNFCESLGDDPMGEIRAACLFELLELPYTGSSPYTLAVALNKARAKEIFSFYKIPTPKFLVAKRSSEIKETGDLSFPLIVKPIAEDGSIG